MSHQLRNLINSQSKAKLEEPFVFSPESTSEELDALVKRPEVVSIVCYWSSERLSIMLSIYFFKAWLTLCKPEPNQLFIVK